MTRERILAAFAATDPSYLASCLAQRQPGQGGAGSRFLSATTLEDLQNVAWEEYSHPAISSPARGYRAPIRGRFGLLRLADLNPETEVVLSDPKSTGNVEAVVEGALGPEVDFTVLLLGPDRSSGKEVVWTFFPGEPIMPSRIETRDFPHGTKVSAVKALELGLEWAKVG